MSTIIRHQRNIRADSTGLHSTTGEEYNTGRVREIAGKVAFTGALALAAAGLGAAFYYGLEHSDMYGRQHDVPQADQPGLEHGVTSIVEPVELSTDK